MRKAFLCTAALWLSYSLTTLLTGRESYVSIGLAAAALAATILWLAHVVGYAARSAAVKTDSALPVDRNKRGSISAFLKVLAVAAVGSAIPQLASATQCGGTKDCSGKTCQNKKDSCTSGYRGCQCS